MVPWCGVGTALLQWALSNGFARSAQGFDKLNPNGWGVDKVVINQAKLASSAYASSASSYQFSSFSLVCKRHFWVHASITQL